jgi:uncharacterized protein YlxW (UPF0749 family)
VDIRKSKSNRRRPDESMSLINDLFRNPLEPGYYEAAKRRASRGAPKSTGARPRMSVGLLIGLAMLGVLLTTAALQVQQDAGAVSAERRALIDRISEESERTERLEAIIADLEAEVVNIQSAALTSAHAGEELYEVLSRSQRAAGVSRVTGPGVIVEMNDAENASTIYDVVLDEDLRAVVNGFWSAGAEAVSINGERITPLSAIRSADGVILVNTRPVAPPYEIMAIGDPRTLPHTFIDGWGGTWLKNAAARYGIRFSVSTSESLTLPGGTASLDSAAPKEAS